MSELNDTHNLTPYLKYYKSFANSIELSSEFDLYILEQDKRPPEYFWFLNCFLKSGELSLPPRQLVLRQ